MKRIQKGQGYYFKNLSTARNHFKLISVQLFKMKLEKEN